MKKYFPQTNRLAVAFLLIIGLYLISLYSYLLFHSITEIFTVVVAGSIFVLAWNTRHWMENGYFLFIGIAFLLVGVIDFLHTLAYKGINVFPVHDANLATQFWILARYIQSISLLIAPIWLKRSLSPWPVIAIYLLLGTLSLALVFTNNFPACYVEGVGLTKFKIVSEYIIIAILASSFVPLFINRARFEPGVWQSLFLFIALTIAAEFAFTAYLGVYDEANLIGHILRLFSYLFLYRALLRTGLQAPYDLIFRDIKLKETALLRSEANLQRLFDISPFPMLITRQSDARFLKVNQATMDMFEITSENIHSFTALDFYANPEERTKVLQSIKRDGKIENEPLKLKSKSGKPYWCLVNVITIEFEGQASLLVGMADISEQKRIQEELQYLSMHDALTGVYNRTYFETEIERLQKGRQHPVSIIMLDTDDLKEINDTYGHAQGDKLLQTVANSIKSILRSEEVFARIGGDEFAILLPHTDLAESQLVITRINEQLKTTVNNNGYEHSAKVSIGLGVAEANDDLYEALKQADENMYTNKFFKKGDTKPLKPLREEWKKDWQNDHGHDKQEHDQ